VSSKVRWQSVSFSFLQIKEWDEEFTIFQPDSGKTHFLNQMGMQILSSLDQSPASADDICSYLAERFPLPDDLNFPQQIIKTLHQLDELGLIEKAGWEPSA
jgi:PqqD family protein of HPr-rel-A system